MVVRVYVAVLYLLELVPGTGFFRGNSCSREGGPVDMGAATGSVLALLIGQELLHKVGILATG
jgi:hypothetical protein